ncbi:MAG: flagellar type III secretion system protein FlhB [Pseudomonadota bacterium]
MSNQEDRSTKSEEPTEKKLKDARKKGDVPSSREPSNLMGVLSLCVITVFMAPTAFIGLAEVLGNTMAAASSLEVGAGRTGMRDLGIVVNSMLASTGKLLTPIVILMVLAALFGVIVQGETVVSVERIKPKASKISLIGGFKRLFSADAMVEFAKNLAKVVVITAFTFWFGRDAVVNIWQSADFVPEAFMRYGREAAIYTLVATTALLAFTASTDVIWKRSQWLKKQRMSLREVRDEFKDSEGDPIIKAKRASIQRQRARQRLTTTVPTASVIVTNPTHYAVALRYEMGRDVGPVCVAKGTDKIAAQIRKIARDAEVPIVESRALARTLHATVEVDEMVPTEHWRAVAEIISYVIGLKRDLNLQPPAGARLRVED